MTNQPLTIALPTTEYVSEANFSGGLANYIHRVALSLQKLGHNPLVFIAADRDYQFTYEGVPVHLINVKPGLLVKIGARLAFKNLKNTLYYLQVNVKLKDKLMEFHQKQPISIIQYPSCGALGLFRIKEIPAVTRISGYLPLWNEAYELKPNIDISLIEKMEELAYLQTDALFAPSRVNAAIVQKVTNRKVSIIETPFILDTTQLNYSVYEKRLKGKKYLLFFGTIGIMKGCGLIADIIEDLLGNHADLDFVLVGRDKGYLGYQGVSLVDTIKRRAGNNSDRVIHLDSLNHNFLYPIIANAYAVVLPSRIDNFPNTCLEAMAHKRIVVGTQGTSFEQLITDGVNGFLCEKDNPQDLLNVIEKLLKMTEGERNVMGDKAYERIEELRPEKAVEQLVGFYQEVIDSFTANS